MNQYNLACFYGIIDPFYRKVHIHVNFAQVLGILGWMKSVHLYLDLRLRIIGIMDEFPINQIFPEKNNPDYP